MPLKLKEPRQGKTPYYSVRGTYLGIYVDKSLGTSKRSVALRLIAELEGKIERREYPEPAPDPQQPTFLSAAVAYMEAGGSRRYVAHLLKYFGEMPFKDIDQAAIDAAAIALHPNVKPATRNAYVYTPVSAILHHANPNWGTLRRPKGAKGEARTDHLNPTDAADIVKAAERFDPEFALLLRFLLYAGCRLGEALAITWADVVNGTAYIATSKNDDPRTVLLRADLNAMLEARRKPDGRVFRFRQGGRHLKNLLRRCTLAVCGLEVSLRWKPGEKRRLPPHRLAFVNFHVLCHTWATWMRRYGGADLQGLVATNRWRDPRSAARYAHVVAHEEWERVEKLPALPSGKIADSA